MAASDLTENVTRQLKSLLDGEPSQKALEDSLRLLAKWRSALLENTLSSRSGREVLSGPFKGLHYSMRSTEGAAPARLVGCYEASLAPVVEKIIAQAYPEVMDIGCAEGYYAVGLARRMPQTVVRAFDTNPSAREACRVMAAANGVLDRVVIGGTVAHPDFAQCAQTQTCVICDIEGAEAQLLDPNLAPGLRHADVLVEVHDCFSPGLSDEISERFMQSHTITRIDRTVDMAALPDWMEELSDLDRILTLWEWRIGATPWLWMQRKASF